VAHPGKKRLASLADGWEGAVEPVERVAEIRRGQPRPLLYSPAEKIMSFNDILEAADQLSLEDQAALVEVLNRRLHERRRDDLVREVQQAERELEAGLGRVMSADDFLKEILS
jgi:hypothetical protein